MSRDQTWIHRMDEKLEWLVFDVALKTRGRVLAGLLVAGALAVSFLPGTAPETQAATAAETATEIANPAYLHDRPWLDDIPMNPTPENPCHAYFFMKEDRQGVYVTFKSRYRQEIELFFYRMRGKDQIEIYFPENKKKAVGKIAIQDHSKGQFDIKMSLEKDPKGKGEYFSFKNWDPGAKGFDPSKIDWASLVEAAKKKL